MDQRPVKVFSLVDSPRLRYIAGIILGDILGLKWEVITDKRKLGKNPVINYSQDKISGSFRICQETLLFEKGIIQKEIAVSDWKGLPVFFKAEGDFDLPFDIFAASFFLITRYEEYLEFQPDKHGRYPASLSTAFRNGFLDKPVIDLWAHELAKSFLSKYPALVFKRNEYRALLTIDSDEPFAFLGKNILRSLGNLLLEKNNSKLSLSGRYRIISKADKDPFDVYDYIKKKIITNQTDSRFFFPVSDQSVYDKNPSWKNEVYRSLIRSVANDFNTGLHPSYNAGHDGTLIESEASRLRTILDKEVTSSRFHYLRLKMPHSYNIVAKTGITEDFSMGYSDQPGFRAGIARPYCFYDVAEDRATELKIVPFQVMDATLIEYKKLEPENALKLILKLIAETRKAGGLFVSIWHNTSLLDSEEWKEWRKVFEAMLDSQRPL